ncbi:helix-turn-helix domain-containing protein [Guyparkeria halophila]|uniref:helix-turn-helix domain-containing protein n=1 Tax=Guyparkeria halophila TaxID=47960 RepID=UPI0018CBFE50|nr:helix-turn-helix transcriptional regulator [Guyparkeria halophila]
MVPAQLWLVKIITKLIQCSAKLLQNGNLNAMAQASKKTVSRRSGLSGLITSGSVKRVSRAAEGQSSAAAKTSRGRLKSRVRSDEQLELISIREQVGLSQTQFALALGVNRSRIVNMENGRILRIPDDVLQMAREMLNDEGRLKRVERLREANMADLLDEWLERLGLRSGGFKPHDEALADLLQLHVNTIYRWRKGISRPDLEVLLQIDRLVEELAIRIRAFLDR